VPTARLSSKSQIVIPAAIRRRLGLRPGDLLEVDQQDDHVVLRKVQESALDVLDRIGGPIWRGYSEELKRTRDEWDD